jgi:protease I
MQTCKSEKPLQDKRILVCISDFSEGLETYYMVYRLMEEGAVPVIAAPVVKRLQTVCHDSDPAFLSYTEKPAYCIASQIAFKDVKPSAYDGLLLPGGRAPEDIRLNKSLLDTVKYFLDNNMPVGAMCHGVQVLFAEYPLQGRKMTGTCSVFADMKNDGITVIDAPVVVDGNLVTSRGWPDLPYFMPKFLNVLGRK